MLLICLAVLSVQVTACKRSNHKAGSGGTPDTTIDASTGDGSLHVDGGPTDGGFTDGALDASSDAGQDGGVDAALECTMGADCDDTNDCTVDTCDGSNMCQHVNAMNGTSCSSGSGTCQSGECVLPCVISNEHKVLNTVLDGTAEELGYAVATDGFFMAVGAPGSNDTGVAAGKVYMYIKGDFDWDLFGSIVPEDPLAGMRFGASVAVDGDTVVVGAPQDDEFGSSAGAVYVYTRSGMTWILQDELADTTGTPAGRLFGFDVNIDGDDLAIGAYGDSSLGAETGAAYVYTRTAGTWSQQQKIIPSGIAAADQVGYSVDIHNGTLVIGAPKDGDNGAESGSAHVYTRSGTVWSLEQKLTASDGDSNDLFGFDVALDGDEIVAGAPDDEAAVNLSGSAYAFERSGTVWTQSQKVTINHSAGGDKFGYSVSVVSGVHLLVGAPEANGTAGNDVGYVGVFKRAMSSWDTSSVIGSEGNAPSDNMAQSVSVSSNAAVFGVAGQDEFGSNAGRVRASHFTSVWTNEQSLGLDHVAVNDHLFGKSTASDGNTLVIGVPDENGVGSFSFNPTIIPRADAGAVYVFVHDGMSWNLEAKLIPEDPSDRKKFGSAVAVVGDWIVVGAPGDSGAGSNVGAAYFFERTGTNWVQKQKLTPSSPFANGGLGVAADMDGTTAVVGSEAGTVFGSGSVIVFTETAGVWSEAQELRGADSASGEQFGSSVSLDGNRMAVGAKRDHALLADDGAVYVFEQSMGTWAQTEKLVASNPMNNANLGAAVRLQGATIVAGAPGHTSDTGAAYVFVHDGMDWVEEDNFLGDDTTAGDKFGSAITLLDMDTAWIGAPSHGSNKGAVYAMGRYDTAWHQRSKHQASDGLSDPNGDQFGFNIAVFGTHLAVGAPHRSEIDTSAGAAYMYSVICP